jgi:AAA+ ATPase superfamily predicted ATPase
MDNPFVYGRVVTGEKFFGRTKLIERIQGYIRTGQNIVVFGERRVGKTSLIAEAISRLGMPCLKVDFYEIRTERELITRAIRGIEKLEKDSPFFSRWMARGKRVRGKIVQGYKQPSMVPKISLEGYFKDPVSSITDLLDYIHDFQSEKPLVAFFDEFQGLFGLENGIDILATMRSEIQTHADTPYIFAGSIRRKMHEIFMDPKHPFYKSALPLEIGPIEFEEIGPIVIQLFESGDRKMAPIYLQGLYTMLYGNTGDFQQLCSSLWEISKPGQTLDKDAILNALDMVWETEMPVYASIRKALTIQQNRVLQTLALTDGKEPFGSQFRKVAGDISPGTVQKALAKLEEMDLVFQPYDSKDYRFYAPFFKLWLINQVVYPMEIPFFVNELLPMKPPS